MSDIYSITIWSYATHSLSAQVCELALALMFYLLLFLQIRCSSLQGGGSSEDAGETNLPLSKDIRCYCFFCIQLEKYRCHSLSWLVGFLVQFSSDGCERINEFGKKPTSFHYPKIRPLKNLIKISDQYLLRLPYQKLLISLLYKSIWNLLFWSAFDLTSIPYSFTTHALIYLVHHWLEATEWMLSICTLI
jgi:hypothetical protein